MVAIISIVLNVTQTSVIYVVKNIVILNILVIIYLVYPFLDVNTFTKLQNHWSEK